MIDDFFCCLSVNVLGTYERISLLMDLLLISQLGHGPRTNPILMSLAKHC